MSRCSSSIENLLNCTFFFFLFLLGTNFGVNPIVKIQGGFYNKQKTCQIKGSVTFDTITCRVPSGQGKNLKVTVTAGGQTYLDIPITISYNAPNIYAIKPSHGPTR